MEVAEIRPGLWRWTAYHEEWKKDVGCVYLEAPDAVVLIDPLVPPEKAEAKRFRDALDRDVKRAGSPVHVLLKIFWHARSAREIVERYGARLWAHTSQRRRIKNRAGEPREQLQQLALGRRHLCGRHAGVGARPERVVERGIRWDEKAGQVAVDRRPPLVGQGQAPRAAYTSS